MIETDFNNYLNQQSKVTAGRLLAGVTAFEKDIYGDADN